MRTFAICAATLALAGVLGASLSACSDGSNGLKGCLVSDCGAGTAGLPSAGASTTNGGSPANSSAGSDNASSTAGAGTTPTGGTGGTPDPGGGGMPQAGGAPPTGGMGGSSVGGAGGTAAGGAAAGGSGGGGVVSGPFKILIVSTALDYPHDSIPDCQQMVSDLGKTDPNNPWTTKIEGDDLADFTDAGLKDYGMVFFCSPNGRVFSGNPKVVNKPAAMMAFQNFIEKDGKAFGGIHSASDFEKTNGFPWFTNALMGAYFDHHGASSTDPGSVVSDSTNKSHPILAGLAATYSTADEWYVMNRDPSTQPGFKIVQRLASDSRPLTWVKDVGAGRMFNTVRGHNKSVYKEEPFRTVVKNGILWATKRVN